MEHVSNKDDVKTSLRKVVKEVRRGCCIFMGDQGDRSDVPGEQRKLKLWAVGGITWREPLGEKAVGFSSHSVSTCGIFRRNRGLP